MVVYKAHLHACGGTLGEDSGQTPAHFVVFEDIILYVYGVSGGA